MPQAVKINIDEEIDRRKLAKRDLQISIDIDELERRAADVEAGRSRLISVEEFWNNVEKAGL